MKWISRFVVLGVVVLAMATLASCGRSPGPVGGVFDAGAISWTDDAQQWNGENDKVYSVTLPAGGSSYYVWGSDIYTDDSSIGTAAVHEGLTTFANGGTVKIRILPGQESYTGSTRNGVTTLDYASWDGSFEFVTD